VLCAGQHGQRLAHLRRHRAPVDQRVGVLVVLHERRDGARPDGATEDALVRGEPEVEPGAGFAAGVDVDRRLAERLAEHLAGEGRVILERL
jgi:hypothetical protein